MVLDARDHLLEVGGVRVLLGSLYSPRPGPTWATDRDRSHLIVNLVGGMPTFEASSHSCLYLGGPTMGEFSWIAPGAEFAGVYGAGRIVFLEISPPPHWPAPRWPCLAAFDLRVLQAARTIQHQVAGGRTRGLFDLIKGIWAHLVRAQVPCDVRRGAALSDRRFEEAQRRIVAAPTVIRSARDLAEQTGTSLDGLNRTFQTRFGMSAARFLDEARLRTARRTISRTAIPLGTIALEAGFASQSHLTDRMRVRIGITPSRLRQIAATGSEPGA